MRLMSGGNWSNSSNCGSQSANCNNFGTYRNDDISARGVADTVLAVLTLGWTIVPCPLAKYLTEIIWE